MNSWRSSSTRTCRVLSALTVLLGGCAAPSADRAPPFDLVCDSADTRQASTLHCVLVDTRNGDVKRVALERLPQSNGPTRATDAPAGTYKLVCDSTDTDTRSDFRCVRLNVRTGELLLVNVPLVGTVPE